MFTKINENRYFYFIKSIRFDDQKEKKKAAGKIVKKQFIKAPLPIAFWTLLTLGYHLIKLRRQAESEIENALAARKIFYCFQVQRKIEQIRKQTNLSPQDLAEKLSQEQEEGYPLRNIYSKEELLRLILQPIHEEILFKAAYFQKRSEDYKKIWKELPRHQASSSPCDIDQINTYYNRLKKDYALSHDDILQLISGKVPKQKLSSIPLPVLNRAFKDLIDTMAS